MVYGAIDLHSRFSQIRIVDAEGAVVADRRVLTTRDRLVDAFAPHGPMRIVVEASTDSEWVAQALEAAGHAVVVADPNYGPMYGTLRRRVKTDGRDAAALAEANRRGWYRAAHRVSPAQRRIRQQLGVRRHLVRLRTGLIAQLRAVLRQEGLRLPSGSSTTVGRRCARVEVPAALIPVVQPLLDAIAALTPLIAAADRTLCACAAGDAIVQVLQTAPGVGPIVALTYRAALDDVRRFATAGQASSALGLVPREDSSGERRRRGRLTKIGPSEARCMLIQAAWSCWRSRSVRTTALRTWTDALAARRGKRIAVVGLARRLSRILYAMWRDAQVFRDPAAPTIVSAA